MRNVEDKLKNLDKQIQQLTFDFQLASSKQDENANALTIRLNELKSQIEHMKMEPVPMQDPPSFNLNYSQPPPPQLSSSIIDNGNKPQDLSDAELARLLQEEFDQQTRAQAAAQVVPAAPAAVSYPNASSATEACPVCGVSFTVGRALEEHVNTHFPEVNQRMNTLTVRNPPPKLETKQETSSWLNRLLGKKEEEPKSYLYAPGVAPGSQSQVPPNFATMRGPQPVPIGQPVYVNRPQAQPMPGQPGQPVFVPVQTINGTPWYVSNDGTPIQPVHNQ